MEQFIKIRNNLINIRHIASLMQVPYDIDYPAYAVLSMAASMKFLDRVQSQEFLLSKEEYDRVVEYLKSQTADLDKI